MGRYGLLGALAAGDPQTVEAGLWAFQQGGNAADALAAAGFAALLAEPFLINLGGGGLALAHLPDGATRVYDFMVDMPSRKPWPGMDFRQIWIHFEATSAPFYVGRASVGVPGLVAGLCRIHQDLGRLPLQVVMQPALHLAREGAVLSQAQVQVLGILREIFRQDPVLEALFFPQGKMIQPGARVRRLDLARTLEHIAMAGPEVFYRGELAQAILQDQETHNGLITSEDLEHYQVLVAEPLWVNYRGWRVALPPPPSRGGGLVALTLHLFQDVQPSSLVFQGVEHITWLAEVMQEVHRARPFWEQLLQQAPNRARDWLTQERLHAHRQALQARLAQRRRGIPPKESPSHPNTTHISVIDREGLVLSMTVTAGEDAGFVVPGTGIQLNNMLGEEDLNPQGFHRLPPGTRLGTMMTPLIALGPQGQVFTVGSGGSARIRDAVFQTFSNFVDFGLSLEASVQAPRVHLDGEGILHLEHGISPKTAEGLKVRGYQVHLWPTTSIFFGGAHAAARNAQGKFLAAGDARRGGAAITADP